MRHIPSLLGKPDIVAVLPQVRLPVQGLFLRSPAFGPFSPPGPKSEKEAGCEYDRTQQKTGGMIRSGHRRACTFLPGACQLVPSANDEEETDEPNREPDPGRYPVQEFEFWGRFRWCRYCPGVTLPAVRVLVHRRFVDPIVEEIQVDETV